MKIEGFAAFLVEKYDEKDSNIVVTFHQENYPYTDALESQK